MTIERQIKVPAKTRWNSTRMAYDVIEAATVKTIVLDLNIEEIITRLGIKAAHSKGGRAVEMRGLIKAVAKS